MASPAPPSAAIEATIQTARQGLLTTQIIFGVGYSLILYDWLLCFKKEMKLIWSMPRSAIKYLYLFCRYWPIVSVPYVLWAYTQFHSWGTCLRIFRIPVTLSTFNQLAAESVLLARTAAFVGHRRSITYPLFAILVALFVFQLWVVFVPMKLVPFIPGDKRGPCLPYSEGPEILCFFLVSLGFDAVVTGLMLWRFFRVNWETGTGNRSPLVQLFVSEGLWYFVFASLGNIANGVLFMQPEKTLSGCLVIFSTMLPDIIACRLIIDLREHGSSPEIVSWLTSGRNNAAGLVMPKLWRGEQPADKPPQGPISTIRFKQPGPNAYDSTTSSQSKSGQDDVELGMKVGGDEESLRDVDIVPDRSRWEDDASSGLPTFRVGTDMAPLTNLDS